MQRICTRNVYRFSTHKLWSKPKRFCTNLGEIRKLVIVCMSPTNMVCYSVPSILKRC
ncbi:Uncharacterised protein [Vibrio cholerae]|nr:Uncharacterised protein [Vibrio cholerae]